MRKPTVLFNFDDFIDWWFPARKGFEKFDSIERRRARWGNVGRLRAPEVFPCLAFETPATEEDEEHNDGPLPCAPVWNFWTIEQVDEEAEKLLARYLELVAHLGQMRGDS